MVRYKTIGEKFKTVTCSQTGEEVTRRKSLAIDHKGDGKTMGKTSRGRTITCATPCKRIKRELAPKPQVLFVPEVKSENYKTTVKQLQKAKVQLKVKVATKALSSKEKVQMKKLLQKKRDEAKKPA